MSDDAPHEDADYYLVNPLSDVVHKMEYSGPQSEWSTNCGVHAMHLIRITVERFKKKHESNYCQKCFDV